MKIISNTVGTTTPRPNWEQNDPTKADYIRNKPNIEELIDTVTPTATIEQTDEGAMLTVQDKNGVTTATLSHGESGVYVGSGDMPDDCNVQIDITGETVDLDKIIDEAVDRAVSLANEYTDNNGGRASQEYLPTSTQAMSGVAVESAINSTVGDIQKTLSLIVGGI